MTNDVFAYGEFLKDPVLRRTLGRVPHTTPAKLRGYRKFLDDLLGFYNLVHEEEGVVEGQLLLGISDDELLLLDKFESEKYHRRVVTVETAAGPPQGGADVGQALSSRTVPMRAGMKIDEVGEGGQYLTAANEPVPPAD